MQFGSFCFASCVTTLKRCIRFNAALYVKRAATRPARFGDADASVHFHITAREPRVYRAVRRSIGCGVADHLRMLEPSACTRIAVRSPGNARVCCAHRDRGATRGATRVRCGAGIATHRMVARYRGAADHREPVLAQLAHTVACRTASGTGTTQRPSRVFACHAVKQTSTQSGVTLGPRPTPLDPASCRFFSFCSRACNGEGLRDRRTPGRCVRRKPLYSGAFRSVRRFLDTRKVRKFGKAGFQAISFLCPCKSCGPQLD